jgi:serine/threonine protein phosphatase 1
MSDGAAGPLSIRRSRRVARGTQAVLQGSSPMLRFKRRSPVAPTPSAAPVVPPGRRCYAIGDIHGRLDLMLDAVAAIRADLIAHPVDRAYLVLVGDLIDRGPRSREIIEFLRTQDWAGITPVFLLGNHEEALLAAYDGDLDALRRWMGFGGAETAESYGVPSVLLLKGDWQGYWQALRAAIPSEHVAFIRDFYDRFALGDYLFVHAGVRPGVAIERQNPADLRWIREEFLRSADDFGAVVVHGHTICEEPELLPNRIGIDTGAYRTGLLTVLRLEGAEQRIIAVRGSAAAD